MTDKSCTFPRFRNSGNVEVLRYAERRAATDRFVSKDEFEAIIAPEAITKAGTYIVTLKCEGEPLPSPIAPIPWWALSHSELRYQNDSGLRAAVSGS